MYTITIRSCAALVLGGGLLMVLAPAEAAPNAKTCKPKIEVEAKSTSWDAAKKKAESIWETKAKLLHGAAFGNYAAAKDRKTICISFPTLGARCKASGGPCAPVVISSKAKP